MKMSEDISLLTAERKLCTGSGLGSVAGDTVRVCNLDPHHVSRYRFHWEALMRDGTTRRQYVRLGDAILQTLFSRLDPKAISKITIYDALPEAGPQFVAEVGIPEGAEAEAFVACSSSFEGPGLSVERVYVYGYHYPEGTPGRPEYVHIIPSWPATGWVSCTRS
jgi:hypothetical protein